MKQFFKQFDILGQLRDLRVEVSELTAHRDRLVVDNHRLTTQIATKASPQQVLDRIGFDRTTGSLGLPPKTTVPDEPTPTDLADAAFRARDPGFVEAVKDSVEHNKEAAAERRRLREAQGVGLMEGGAEKHFRPTEEELARARGEAPLIASAPGPGDQ